MVFGGSVFGDQKRDVVEVIRNEGYWAFSSLSKEEKEEYLQMSEKIVNEFASIVEIHNDSVEDVDILPYSKLDIFYAGIILCFVFKARGEKDKQEYIKALLLILTCFQKIEQKDKKYAGHISDYFSKFSNELKESIKEQTDTQIIIGEVEKVNSFFLKYSKIIEEEKKDFLEAFVSIFSSR